MIPLLLPKYDVELIAENGKHNYRVRWKDGEAIYPGVTGVLGVIAKPALIPWAKRIALENMKAELIAWRDGPQQSAYERDEMTDEIISRLIATASKRPEKLKDEAAELGTEAHAYIDKFIRGERLGPLRDEILEPVHAFADWWKRGGFKFIAGDTKVASRTHGYGGSLDALAYGGSRIVLLDWKTSKSIYDEYALQVAAYVKAFEEQYVLRVDAATCVRFRKHGVLGPAFEALEVRDIDASFEAFLAAKKLQESMKLEHFIRPPKQEKPNGRSRSAAK